MPSIEVSKLQGIAAPRTVSGGDRAQIDARTAQTAVNTAAKVDAGVKLEVGASIDAAQPPINNERVAEIRTALEKGNYPLVPTQIADAMIAAQISLETVR
ncbi:flagellar biosynthesis anti-sigma factor FlgM [Erythrobacter insulae]|uniref:Flagellar biosynthesis anti-sigma factor FlgM n=1 Tax=Erythrobacter insulae TaxID=2584124 RepID=A0A547PAC5_9SPHN|nr:flagellar biosynthesis anti-sigma factor FlgM [Erythrobacter insulae]TRD11085.1 flagellar biosynthesis anti-sigma factor FlgM [Erythrobacter insulae]